MSKRNRGGSNLVLVLVIAMLLVILSVSIQAFSLLSTRQSAQSVNTQNAYFSAEGTLYDTIRYMEDNETWPSTLPYTDIVWVGDTQVHRTIQVLPDGSYQINVTADVHGTLRSLEGTYRPESSSSNKIDVMLVIDKSLSMGTISMEAANNGALAFIDVMEDSGIDANIGLIYFSYNILKSDLFTPYETLRSTISTTTADGSTNIAAALQAATDELDLNGRPDADKFILILSDGVPNLSYNSCAANSCGSNMCMAKTPTGFGPDNAGTCCSQDAIQLADEAKHGTNVYNGADRNYTIFGISLTANYETAAAVCTTPAYWDGDAALALEKVKELGRKTLLRVTSEDPSQPLPAQGDSYTYYKETAHPEDLESIYQQLAEDLQVPGGFRYKEVDPQPLP